MTRWLLVSAILLLAPPLRLGAQNQQDPSARFPPPVGYRVVERTGPVVEAATFYFNPNQPQMIRGRVWRVSYEAPAPIMKRPIDVVRHYRDQIVSQGGRRLHARFTQSDGEIAAWLPGAKPAWVNVRSSGEEITVEIAEQESWATPSPLPVASERLAGRWMADNAPTGMTAAERVDVAAVEAAFGRLLRVSDALRTPTGYEFQLTSAAGSRRDVPIPSSGPLPFVVELQARTLFQECDTCPVGRGSRLTSAVQLHGNSVDEIFTSLGYSDERGQPLGFARGAPSGSAPSSDAGKVIVYARAGGPPLWLPVSRESWLKAQIRGSGAGFQKTDADSARQLNEAEKMVKEMESIDPASAREMRRALAELRARAPSADSSPIAAQLTEELAALSDDERSAPAMLGDQAVVTPNPEYFNRTLKRSAVQLLVVQFEDTESVSQDRFHLADLIDRLERADWSSLAALVR